MAQIRWATAEKRFAGRRVRPPRGPWLGKSEERRRSSGQIDILDDNCWQASTNFPSSSAMGQVVAAVRALSNRSQPGGTISCWRRKISRSRRFARLRNTACPTAAVEATTPRRFTSCDDEAIGSEPAVVSSRRKHQSVKAPQLILRPCSRIARKSRWRRKCCSVRKRMGAAGGRGRSAT